MMRVLVTGATGLLGSRLLLHLASLGHRVTGANRHPPSDGSPRADVALRACDLSDMAQVSALFEAVRPEAVIHAAAMTDVDACERDPDGAWRANVEATAHVARAAVRFDAHLVHTSTDYVFDGLAGPYREDDVPNPLGLYALTKHASEEAVRVLSRSAAIARTAVVFSHPPAPTRTNFGVWLLETLKAGRPAHLFRDQFISPTLAENAAEMVAEIALRRLSGIWHTAGGTVLDRVSFGRALCRRFGLDEGLLVSSTLAEVGLQARRPPRCGLVTEKVRRELSVRPLSVEEALDRFFNQAGNPSPLWVDAHKPRG